MRALTKYTMTLWKDIINFFFPRHCIVCGHRLSIHEKHICFSCLALLPRTNYHLAEHSVAEQIFWGRFPIEKAVCFFFYDARNIRQILWSLKYDSNPYIGKYLARIYAREIKGSGFFDGIDGIIPVPLAWMRKLKRGYNQSEYIAQGISEETGIPMFNDIVVRIRNNETQTRLGRAERQANVKDIFSVIAPEKASGKHFLIVDDVLTTGSTISSLCETLVKSGNIKISVLTLAIAGSQKGLPVADKNNNQLKSD
ncbi:MAG: ComF family protein [Bacteroidaceae bacterium]|nr:ComF family protein [Bacteroidaceae bacterium]